VIGTAAGIAFVAGMFCWSQDNGPKDSPLLHLGAVLFGFGCLAITLLFILRLF
jgi:hypothetical protein